MEELAEQILEEGRRQNLFGSSITVQDIKDVLEVCLESTDRVLQDVEDEAHYGEYLHEYRSRFIV